MPIIFLFFSRQDGDASYRLLPYDQFMTPDPEAEWAATERQQALALLRTAQRDQDHQAMLKESPGEDGVKLLHGKTLQMERVSNRWAGGEVRRRRRPWNIPLDNPDPSFMPRDPRYCCILCCIPFFIFNVMSITFINVKLEGSFIRTRFLSSPFS